MKPCAHFGRHWPTVTPLILAILTGCTSTIRPPKNPYTEYPAKQNIPLRVAVNITDELKNYQWRHVHDLYPFVPTVVMPVGRGVAINAPVLAKQTFVESTIVTNRAPLPQGIDGVLTAKVMYANRTEGPTSFSKSITAIKVEWALTDSTGTAIWVDTITGEGAGSSGWSSPEKLLRIGLEKLLRKTHRAMIHSKAIGNYAASLHPGYSTPVDSLQGIDPGTEDLCDSLDSTEVDEIRETLREIQKMKIRAAAPCVVKCLQHGKPEIVREACRVLANLGDPATIASLEKLLNDERSDIRNEAQKAIARLAPKP